MAKTFETFMEEERARLTKDRETALSELRTAQDKINAVDRELAAITAYEQVKAGKTFHPQTERKPRAPSTGRAPRGDLSELQKRILAIIRNYLPEGVKAPSIYDELSAVDAAQKRPINAALNRMKNAGVVAQAGRRKPYTLGPNAPSDAHPQPPV